MKYIYLTLISVLFFSCIGSSIEKRITIKDFSHSFIDSLKPNARMVKAGYIAHSVEIKGYTNDTIIVYFSMRKKYFEDNKKHPTYLSGEINERYFEEYSGKTQKYLQVEPYKATKGKLKIKYGLYK